MQLSDYFPTPPARLAVETEATRMQARINDGSAWTSGRDVRLRAHALHAAGAVTLPARPWHRH